MSFLTNTSSGDG